jgi:signal transduction histidine kinase
MNQIPALPFERSGHDDRVIAGVCGGLASTLGVDATLVRLVFALLALAGGAGILLYFALWAYDGGRRSWPAALLIAAAACSLLLALGLSGAAVLGVGLIVGGVGVILVRGGSIRQGGSLPKLAIVLMVIGAATLLGHVGTSNSFIGPGAVVGTLLLVLGPWVWQLWREHQERIRLQERAEVAARIHDSVLQTLALVQRHANDAPRVSAIARRQERELRRWLYGSGVGDAVTLADALAEAATEVEELHGVRVELASGGDLPLDESLEQLVLAAREAMTNAAKFSTADEISVYLEADGDHVAVFVRDRGIGFDRTAVPADRRGLAESVDGRMRRAGGTATIVSSPGSGTEVELTLPRAAQ